MKAQRKSSKQKVGGKSGRIRAEKFKPSRIQGAQRMSPEQFVDIIEHINDGLVVLDRDWRYVYVNQKAAVMLQRSAPSDLIGKHIWTEYPEGIGQPFQIAYEQAMNEQIPIVFEDHYEPWDLWFENRIYPSSDGIMILFTEVTDRKRTEELLTQRQYFLKKILDTEPGTVYIYDVEQQSNVYVNHHWLLAFGYTEEETRAMGSELFHRIIHPEDLQRVSVHHETWEGAGEHDVREIEFRVCTKAGEWRWLHSREVPFVRDETGKIRQILGITHDITEQKQAQQALRDSEEKFSKVFHASPVPLSITRVSDGHYVEANESLLHRMGYLREEILGRTALELGLWANPAKRDEMLSSLQQQGTLRNYETQFRTKSGEIGTALLFREIIELAGEQHFIGTTLDITERKQMEDAVLQERDFSDGILNSLPGVFYFYDDTGKFIRWNRNFEIVSGYSAEEISRMHPLDFFTGEEKKVVEAKIREVFETGESDVEAGFLSSDGQLIPYYFTGKRIELDGAPYLIGMGIDIRGRRQAEEALAASEAELRALFAAMNDVVLVIDCDGVYRKIAPTNPHLLYKPPEELLGKTLGDIFPPERAQSFLNTIHHVAETQEIAHIEYQLSINGKTLWFDASISPMGSDQILWMARDISKRKRAEEELRTLNEDLEQRIAARTEELAAAMVRAQESDRLKSAFLATMSHELRTPLNSIIGFTGVILQGLAGPINEEQTKQLNMSRASARHLLALINDVLDISKIEAGQLEIIKQPFDMRQTVEKVLQIVQPLIQKKHLNLEVVLEQTVGVIRNDRRRVEQVLINLVNNAVKFTAQGTIKIECKIKDGWLETSVHDEGIGIKAEDMDRLFKPFQQIDIGLARNHEGTGLGLSICQRLVTAMGGEIRVESQWGTGSTFTFTLPV